MSNAVVVDVADAVKAMLVAATLSQTIAPERSYADWELSLEDSDVLHVDVVPVTTGQQVDLNTRGTRRYTVPIDIAIRKRFSTTKQNDDTGRISNEQLAPAR